MHVNELGKIIHDGIYHDPLIGSAFRGKLSRSRSLASFHSNTYQIAFAVVLEGLCG